MFKQLRRLAVMTARTWFPAQPERRQGIDRRQRPDRRMDPRFGESMPCRRCRERRKLLASN